MPSVSCPSCSARVRLSGASRLRCPGCGERFAVPDEDDEDDRARRTKPTKGGVPAWVFMASGAAVTLVIVLVVLAVVLGRGKGGKGVDPLAVFDTPPEGYGAVRDSAGGFRVYLPGSPRKGQITESGKGPVTDAERVVWASSTGGGFGTPLTVFGVLSVPLPAGTKPGPPEEFEKLVILADPSYEGGKGHEVTSRKLATLDGRPSLEIRMREHPEFFRKDPPPPPEEFEKRAHTVYYVTTNGKKVAVIKMRLNGTFVDERMLRTIADSFSFL